MIYLPIGIPGCGKSTFGALHFKPSEIVNPDSIREMLTDDMTNQTRNREVFEIAHKIVEVREGLGLDTYFDATNVQPERWPKGEIRTILFTTPYNECDRRNRTRSRVVPDHVMERMFKNYEDLRHSDDFKVDYLAFLFKRP